MSRRSKQKISDKWIKLIKAEVEKRFGKKILSKGDCEELSDSIFNHTGQLINYNTLRRFFGLVKSNSLINRTSLNILAEYCGFTDFDILIHRKDNFDINVLNYYFIEIINNNFIDFQQIKSLCDEYGDWPQIYPFLEKCLLHSQKTEDVEFFAKFYLLPKVFTYSLNKRKHIYNIALLYASIVYRFPYKIKTEIIRSIARQKNAIRFFFEIFVDIDNIESFYNDVLQEYFKNTSTVPSRLFYYNLMVYRAFMLGESIQLAAFFDKLGKIEFKNPEIHPALLGRCLASEIYYSSQHGVLNKMYILNEVKTNLDAIGSKDNQALLQSQLYLIYIFQALQFSGNIAVLSELVNSINPLVINICDHLTENATNHLKIYIAHHLVYSDDLDEAERIIESISIKSFPLFEKETQTLSYELMIKDYFQKKGNSEKVDKITAEILNLKKMKGFEI